MLCKIHYNFNNISLPSQGSWRSIQDENLMEDIQRKLVNNCINNKTPKTVFQGSRHENNRTLPPHLHSASSPIRTTEPSQIWFIHFSNFHVQILERPLLKPMLKFLINPCQSIVFLAFNIHNCKLAISESYQSVLTYSLTPKNSNTSYAYDPTNTKHE